MGRAAVDSSAGAAVCLFVQDSLDTLVKKFWSLEEVPVRRLLSPDEVKCEELFNSSYSRDDEGRFTVRLPFRLPPEMLGSSLSVAASRFRSLERKFSRDSALAVSYGKMIKEYETDGTLSRVCSIQEVGNELAYYMPHHGVHRPNHPTTPLRIVFNASAATSSSYSLNQLMFVGPKLQADIFEVLIHFRLFQFAITADIRRMFLQINVAKEDRRFQRLVWRSDPAEPLQVFELNKVVFGNASSPYLANRVVKQLAALERARFPMAAAVADRDVYVDDVASSVDTYNELTELHRQLGEMFASGGFTLSKWASNSVKLISTISPESRLMSDVDFDHDTPSKVLGVQWSPRQDHFSCVVDLPDLPCTKRNILSVTARIFDPLGLVAPVTLTAKLLIHRLWREGCGWDETPANSVVQEWEGYKRALPLLRNVSVGRHVGVVSGSVATLVGFADSSTKAYGACIYVHTANSGQSPTVKLLCAKSRVAPQKGLTIPRLELCAALLLSNLMKTVLNAYTPRYQFKNVVAFTDSKVVLCWIQSDPSRWKIFVVKAVHIELVSDLSTEMFLAAFKRFLSRRGPCRFILSDGGTNFIGARRRLSELDDLVGSSSFDKSMGTELAAHGIEWKINPPNGPWFGGIWESNIKTVKGHLQRIIGNQILTYEEFNTTLVQIEAIMNSRPLCVLNSDPSSPTALTPAHFLTVGASLDRLPTENVQDIPVNRLQRYQLMDRIVQEYWARWRQEYLHTLQARSKWTQDATPIEEGTVVVLMKDNVPTLSWPLGVIERCHYGRDGVARVVDVRTHTGTYRRPEGRVCPLPTQ
ncbi:unnamed protein product [Nesidiocoris tenuis]|uniref:Integrase catalytic domain-containing protein n=1 Tax=Nesidiocoris tenuis TaxID=355587 RepID=A0A6H5GRA7_9HEMI|nr:unnamed protein product [Nesidiocoris tenuis]